MAVGTQLGLLLWKNLVHRRRQRVQLAIELLWPLFLFVILIAVRQSHPPFQQHQCHFPNKALPSAGTLPWLQGIICNVNNPCFQHPTPGEAPGVVGNFNGSILSRLLAEARRVVLHAERQQLPQRLAQLLPALRGLGAPSPAPPARPLRDFLREDETLARFLRTNASLPPALVEELLGARLNPRALFSGGARAPPEAAVCNGSELGAFLEGRDNTQQILPFP